MKSDIKQFAQALGNYSDYLEKSLKKTRLNHSLTSPVCELSDNLCFRFLPVCNVASSTPACSALQQQLEEKEKYHHVSVEEFAPTEYQTKYNFIQAMKKSGFPFPAALVTHTHGNNVGS